MRVLRVARNYWICALMERDLSGQAPLAEVMAAMTLLAERVVGEALDFLSRDLAARHGVPESAIDASPEDLMVVAMGKFGGAELNVSSDIDLVFVYADAGECRAKAKQQALSNHEFFTKLARRLMRALSEMTADGHVFRVDMRLRPNGDSGPLVVSLAMLEEYFITQGRTWERFAWLKARAVGPAVFAQSTEAARAALAELVTPFVYRRYLDFGAIEALRSLHGQIRGELARRDAQHHAPECNVKLGRGGIREIEFLAQHFQLVRGGRDAGLRSKRTLETLAALDARGLLSHGIAQELAQSYEFLRHVEHRLQYLDDAQTHTLPSDTADLERIAAMCGSPLGIESGDALKARIARVQAFVARQFDEVFGVRIGPAGLAATEPGIWNATECSGAASPGGLAALRAFGYDDPEAAQLRLRALWNAGSARSLNETGRERLDALMPQLIARAPQHATTACDASTLLGRLCDLIEVIARRSSYLSLLIEHPGALEHVCVLLAASPWAARFLAQHPLLLDELLDTRNLERLDGRAVRAQLASELAALADNPERAMDVLRELQHLESFRLLMLDLEGRLSVEALSDDLSELADAIVAAALDATWRVLAPSAPAPPAFAVIAYGKLGGKELGYNSDLDLVFLYDDARTDDVAVTLYARLAQRLVTWLSSRTPAGGLYEVDLRLRPEGAAGLLVGSLTGFEKYQQEHAWMWEHQALTRARYCAGDAALGSAFEAQRRAILARVREPEALRSAVRDMRQRMHDGHPNHSEQFDLKHDPGGMVDIEFCVQYLVLGHARQWPGLLDNVGNIALLGRAGEAGLIDAQLAGAVANAYRTYRRASHALRLAGARYARLPAGDLAEERQAVTALVDSLGLNAGQSVARKIA